MSRWQLHEAERGARERLRLSLVSIRDAATERSSVRSCGMEAVGAAQHRTKVKLRKAPVVWVSMPTNVTPSIQTRPGGIGDGCGAKLCVLTQGDLYMSATCGRAGGGDDDRPTRVEKSDHLVVVRKPGNAGGAKEMTG